MAKKKEVKSFGGKNFWIGLIVLLIVIVSIAAYVRDVRLNPDEQIDHSDTCKSAGGEDADEDGYCSIRLYEGGEFDCNDGNANINPLKYEDSQSLCNDGIDNNCDELSDCSDSGCDGQKAFLPSAGLTLAPTGMCCSGSAVSIDTTDNCGSCGNTCAEGVQCVFKTCFDRTGWLASVSGYFNNRQAGCFPIPSTPQELKDDLISSATSIYDRWTSVNLGSGASLNINPLDPEVKICIDFP